MKKVKTYIPPPTPPQKPKERKEGEQPKPRFTERPKKQSKFMLRIKRALAGFLRDELLDHIGYKHNVPFHAKERFSNSNGTFKTFELERIISLDMESIYPPDDYRLENAITEVRDEFAQELLQYIHVDAQNLTTQEYYMRRSVRFSITIKVAN